MMTNQTKRICLDADMGESFGANRMGNDAALMPNITSANIACGLHAGDPVVMSETIELAMRHGVCIGAHPGFNDIWGFGRRRIVMPPLEVEYLVTYQIGALQALAEAKGGKVEYVKPHGALNNMAHDDADLALAIARGIRAAGRDLIFVANCLSEMVTAGKRVGIPVIHEAYADRNYLHDGRLMPRDSPASVIKDPIWAAERALEMLETQHLTTHVGTRLPSKIDTFCIHGDEPVSVAMASHIRECAAKSGIVPASVADVAN